MVDTQSYIRKNLQPYAVNDHFGFTPKPRELKPLPASTRNKVLYLGDVEKSLRTLDIQKGFFSPLNQSEQLPSVAHSLNVKSLKRGQSGKKSPRQTSSKASIDLNYEPIILPKERRHKSRRLRKKNKNENDETEAPKDPKAMTMIAEEPLDVQQEGNEMDILMEENLDLKG